MVGQGVLRGCLLDPDVESVLAVVRNASLPQQDKLREIAHQDVSDLAAIEDRLSGYDACFFCLGVSSVAARGASLDSGDEKDYGMHRDDS
jgi:putative NADH-flavin reductase